MIDPDSSIYNLALVDVIDGELSDKTISNNGDTWKILATVANEVENLLEVNPGSIVFAEGSTQSRTRLYRMGLTKYHDNIIEKYQVLGFVNGEWLVFDKEIAYEAFPRQTHLNLFENGISQKVVIKGTEKPLLPKA